MRRLTATSILVVCLAVGIPSATALRQPSESQSSVRQQIADLMTHCNERDEFNGVVLVSKGEDPIYEGAFGYADYRDSTRTQMNTVYDVASTTKPLTATAILILVEAGQLSLSDAVSTVIAGFPYPTVTIEHLLSHTSGIVDYSHHPAFIEITHSHTPADSGGILTNADVLQWLKTESPPLEFEPGEKMAYCNTGYLLLATIVEAVSGQSFASFVQERILTPAGMKNSMICDQIGAPSRLERAFGFEPTLDGKGYQLNDLSMTNGTLGDGGLFTTAEDLRAFWYALQGGDLLSRQLIERAMSPTVLISGEAKPYGFGWIVREATAERPLTVKHGGKWRGFLTAYALEPDYDYSIIILTNDSMYPPTIGELELAISRILHQLPYVRPRYKISDVVARTIFQEGRDAAVRTYEELRDKRRDEYFFDEDLLNLLGYQLLWANRVLDAIAVLELNAREYPDSPNVYDSLGDIYQEAGETQLAIENYRRALRLDPDLGHTSRKLNKLVGGPTD